MRRWGTAVPNKLINWIDEYEVKKQCRLIDSDSVIVPDPFPSLCGSDEVAGALAVAPPISAPQGEGLDTKGHLGQRCPL